jgi:hypothetical protein
MAVKKKTAFADRTKAPRLVRVVHRVVIIGALILLSIALWSGYRAIVQIFKLELSVVSADLRPGIPAVVHVVTSGRTNATVRLELVQGTHSELLANMRVSGSRSGFYDPRTRQGTMTPAFTTEFLARFQPGPAIVRATATGSMEWLRVPPPTVREVSVVIGAP